MIRVRDLEAAERAVDKAMEELRAYSENPEMWSAHERLSDKDTKTLVLHKAHFERLEHLSRQVEQALANLRARQAAFGGGS